LSIVTVAVIIIIIVVIAALLLVGLAMAVKMVKQYERGVLFRLGRSKGTADDPVVT
jgi:regulator of protease activity HflC (stomatin/prohibitin superfamily)